MLGDYWIALLISVSGYNNIVSHKMYSHSHLGECYLAGLVSVKPNRACSLIVYVIAKGYMRIAQVKSDSITTYQAEA